MDKSYGKSRDKTPQSCRLSNSPFKKANNKQYSASKSPKLSRITLKPAQTEIVVASSSIHRPLNKLLRRHTLTSRNKYIKPERNRELLLYDSFSRDIISIKKAEDSKASTRIPTRENQISNKKFEEKIIRLHRDHEVIQLKSANRIFDVESEDKDDIQSKVHSVVFRYPVKKTHKGHVKPSIKRISFGSRRRTFDFNMIRNEEKYLRNSDIFGDKLVSNGGDDDCDTDEAEFEKARFKCRMDLAEGVNRTWRKINTEIRNKSADPLANIAKALKMPFKREQL